MTTEDFQHGHIHLFIEMYINNNIHMYNVLTNHVHHSIIHVSPFMEVQEGFEKKLILVGVGYRATVERKALVLNLGFSYPVKMQIP